MEEVQTYQSGTGQGLAHRVEVDAIVSVLTSCGPIKFETMFAVSQGCPCVVDVMKRLPDLGWHHSWVCANPSTLLSDCRELAPHYRTYVCQRLDLRLGDVLESADHPDWDWWSISMNEHIVTSIDVVREHPDLPWNWYALSINERVDPIRLMKHFPEKVLVDEPHENQSLPLRVIMQRLKPPHERYVRNGSPQDIREIFQNILATKVKPMHVEIFLSPSTILEHKHAVDWDWEKVIRHRSLTLDMIRKHSDVPWDMKLYWQFHPDRSSEHWTPGMIPAARGELWARFLDCEPEVREFARRHMAAFRIQTAYLKAYYSPAHPICQRRIQRWS